MAGENGATPEEEEISGGGAAEIDPAHQALLDRAKEEGIEVDPALAAQGQETPEEPEANAEPEKPGGEQETPPAPEGIDDKSKDDLIDTIQKRMEYMERQNGSIQSMLAKMQTQGNPEPQKAPGLLEKLPEEERQNTAQIVGEIFEQRFGERFKEMEEATMEVKRDASRRQSQQSMEAHLGADYEKVEPTIVKRWGELEEQLKNAPDQETFEQASRELALAQLFPTAFADSAHKQYLLEMASKSDDAKLDQVRRNADRSTAVPSAGAPNTGNLSIMGKVKAGKDVSLEDLQAEFRRTLDGLG